MSSNAADDIGPSFWSLKRGRADFMFNDELEDQAEQQQRHFKRQKIAIMKAYGIGYDWITEPPGCGRDGPDWQDIDHLFEGAVSDEVDRVEKDLAQRKEDATGNEESDDEKLKEEKVLNRPLDFQRIITYPDRLFRDTGLPSPSNLAGTYDIIFYAGELEGALRHHRTAKGTLALSTRNDDADQTCLIGAVDMHPSMDLLDVIPFGGNLKFEEVERVQRIIRTEWSRAFEDVTGTYKKVDNSNKEVDATGVIKIKVTDPPDGMPLNMRSGGPCDFRGEVRIFRERVAAGIVQEPHEWSDEPPSSKHCFGTTGAKTAEEVLEAHYEKTCSWLHNHTILTKTAASKVGEFLCPPPVFFFERGDICLDFWWGGLRGFTFSQLIARRCAPSTGVLVNSTPCRALTNEEKHRQEIKHFEEEIQKLEVKKQLAFLAFHCQKEISRSNSLQLDFEVDSLITCERDMLNDAFDVTECVRYMDESFFGEQLSRYNLCLQSQELCFPESWDANPYYRFIFTRIENE